MSDEPLSDDSKPRSYDVTFSNPLFDFNDDFTLCNDNPLFDKEFEDISSMDPPKSAPLNHDPLEYPNLVSRSLETSDLNLEEITAEIGLDDSITTEIDNGYYDSEGHILFLEHRIIKETFSDPTPAVLPKKSTLLSGGKTRVMETPSFGFHHMPSPFPTAYSLKEAMYCYYHPHLTLGDVLLLPSSYCILFLLLETRTKTSTSREAPRISSDESKVHIEVLSVLWGNRLPIPDSSLPLSSSVVTSFGFHLDTPGSNPTRAKLSGPAAELRWSGGGLGVIYNGPPPLATIDLWFRWRPRTLGLPSQSLPQIWMFLEAHVADIDWVKEEYVCCQNSCVLGPVSFGRRFNISSSARRFNSSSSARRINSFQVQGDLTALQAKPTIEENGVTRTKKYAELSIVEKIQADCDMKATNIIFQGLPADIYSLVNHHRVSKDLWERVQLLMQDDLIAYLTKVMAFLIAAASSRFPSTNNQLRTFSNLRNQATVQDGRVIVQQARVVKCYNCQSEGHITRRCTQPKRPRNAAWYKDKAMLAEAHEAGQILDEKLRILILMILTVMISRMQKRFSWPIFSTMVLTLSQRPKSTCNKKNDRISRTPSRNIKNKAEAQPRKVNKKNRVVEPICDVDVKHSLLKGNSELICATCKKYMFDGVHDICLIDSVENANNNAKSAKKHKKQNIWKPTGHVFTEVGLKWKPTGNRSQLMNFVSKFLGTVRFKNDHIARIMGYGDYQLGNDNPSHVYKLKKAFYGLKQAPRTWYDMLSSFLISQHFSKRVVDPTLFTRKAGNDLLPDTRRSTSRSTQLLGDKLVSWSSKKQKSTAISSTQAGYISLSRCYAQIIWMHSHLTDYGFQFNNIPLYRDNKSATTTFNIQETSTLMEYMCKYKFLGMQQDQEFVTGDNDDQFTDKEVTKAYWFKKLERSPTLDPDWSKRQYVKYDQHAYLGTSHWSPKHQSFYGHASNMTSSKYVYSRRRIIVVIRIKIMKKYDYGHLEEIEVHRDDQKLYTFREVCFECGITYVHQTYCHSNAGGRSSIRCRKLPKEAQPSDTYRLNLISKTAYASYSDPHGIIYVDQYRRKRLMRANELYKFSDGMLNDVWSALHDIVAEIRREYLPLRKWSNLDKKRDWVMV
uniref:CCHC-type domain-containing protein n=1 Tax=Tanacetum cinerariifolium TaxID=118510 RepID=A0A6L2MJF6_TANCI|nr:hypothetical protein [Tanacetum cinerariifolium]